MAAVLDKSKAVRYRACQLLAYAQDRKLLPAMEQLSKQVAADSIEDLNAALDAVANQNQHWFLDRTHSGKVFMNMFGMSD
ncbi:MAG: hypothetical protein HC855_10270 [Rhizobiales bacterium]|nr:hypothetical protein [Hyphomicrobiales bacterium]